MSKEKKFTRNKQQKIDLIVNVAQDLIREKGYDKLSTNHIADKAKIGIGTIYRNFPNGKVDIMREIVIRDSSIIINLDLFNDRGESDLPKAISKIVTNFIDFHHQNKQFDLALERALQVDNEFLQEFIQHVEEVLAKVTIIVKQRFPLKELTESQIKKRLFLTYNVVESIIRRHILLTPLFDNDEELGVYLTDLAINIIMK